MALSPGTRIGSYEITALIGAGGMGEVYRAADTNLKRSVAIKVLPVARQIAEALESAHERFVRPPLEVVLNWRGMIGQRAAAAPEH